MLSENVGEYGTHSQGAMLKHILSYFKKYIFMIVLLYAIILMHGA